MLHGDGSVTIRAAGQFEGSRVETLPAVRFAGGEVKIDKGRVSIQFDDGRTARYEFEEGNWYQCEAETGVF